MVLVIGSDTYLTLGTAPSINLGSSGNKLEMLEIPKQRNLNLVKMFFS